MWPEGAKFTDLETECGQERASGNQKRFNVLSVYTDNRTYI